MDNQNEKGQILKKARESKGLGLDVVHEATKIPMDVLRAIEEGYTVRTLSPFYYRGFLKMYAKYLKVDVGTVIENYQPEKLPKLISSPVIQPRVVNPQRLALLSQAPLVTTDKKELIKKIVIGILVFVCALFIFGKIKSFFKNKAQAPRSIQKTSIKKESRSKTGSGKVSKEEKKSERIVREVLEKQNAVQNTVILSPLSSALASAEKPSKNIHLSVRAKIDHWLEVKVDGQTVFRSNLKKGAVETWLANDNIEISGKNVNELEFELNGKMLGSLGREERRAKKVVITKNGLSIKQ